MASSSDYRSPVPPQHRQYSSIWCLSCSLIHGPLRLLYHRHLMYAIRSPFQSKIRARRMEPRPFRCPCQHFRAALFVIHDHISALPGIAAGHRTDDELCRTHLWIYSPVFSGELVGLGQEMARFERRRHQACHGAERQEHDRVNEPKSLIG